MPVRLEALPSSWLRVMAASAIVALAAGVPLNMPVAGRNMALGPTDAIVFLLALSFPMWYRRLPPMSALTVGALLYVLWAWASAVFWSLDYRRSVLTAKSLLEAAILFVACWHVARAGGRTIERALRVFSVILVLQIIWVVWRLLGQAQALGYYALKSGVMLPLGGSNYLAVFLEFSLFFELVTRRRGWPLLVALNAAGIILTFSRGALLASFVVLVLTALVMLFLRGRRTVALVVFVILAGASVVLAATPSLQVLIQAFDIVTRTADSRLELWQDAWRAAAERPLTGVGYGAYESIGTHRDAHSQPMALLAETGVTGLVLFSVAVLGALGRLLAVAARRENEARRGEALGIVAGMLAVLLHSFIEPFFAGSAALWTAAICGWIAAPWGPRPADPEVRVDSGPGATSSP